MNLSVTVVFIRLFKPSLIKIFILILGIIFKKLLIVFILILLKLIKLRNIRFPIIFCTIWKIGWIFFYLSFSYYMTHSLLKIIFIFLKLIIKIFNCLHKRDSFFNLTFRILISYLICTFTTMNSWNFI